MKVLLGYLQLAKTVLCIFVGFTAVFGALLAFPEFNHITFGCGIALTLLSMGGATINSYQERNLDKLMERTRKRPLPRQMVSSRAALLQGTLLLLSGFSLVVILSETILPSLTAIIAVFLYNGVYTPLKQHSILSIIPGALCGAMPPYIGWLLAGGEPVSYGAVLLIALLTLWQVPHFLLVMLIYPRDYTHSKQPNLLRELQEKTIRNLFITWIGALVIVKLLFLTMQLQLPGTIFLAVSVNGCLLFGCFLYGLLFNDQPKYRTLFIFLNVALWIHMALIAFGLLYR